VDELSRLLLLARDGDDSALADFVREMHAPIRRFCTYLVGPDDADDAAPPADGVVAAGAGAPASPLLVP